jgi:hypothetical protein
MSENRPAADAIHDSGAILARIGSLTFYVKNHINTHGSKGRRAETSDLARDLEDRFHGFSQDRPARDGLCAVPGPNGRTPFSPGQDACWLWRGNDDRGEGKPRRQRRAVYTVRYAEAIFVLHAFQKKSKKGVATPKMEIDLIKKRLRNLIEEREERR